MLPRRRIGVLKTMQQEKRGFLSEVWSEWSGHQASRWAAVVAYHTLFSLAPVLVIAVAVAGAVFGTEAARGEVMAQMEGFLGKEGAAVAERLLSGFGDKSRSAWTAAGGGAVLLWGASNVFVSLRESLDYLWDLKRKPGAGWRAWLKERAAAFALVLGVGFVLLVSLMLSTATAAFQHSLSSALSMPAAVVPLTDAALSFLVSGALFALIFKFLPSCRLEWRDAAEGAAVTSLFFILGKSLLGAYLGRNGAASAYGAAGSVVLILLWVNYSAQILFIGAAILKVRGRRAGRPPKPGPFAEPSLHCPAVP